MGLLGSLGYELVAESPPKSFVMVDGRGRQVDLHPVTFDSDGGGVYEMDDGTEWVYPAEGFSGRGSVDGTPVKCLSPAVQVLVHAGYELQERTTASCTCYGSASASIYPTSSCLRSCPRETTTQRKHLRMRECCSYVKAGVVLRVLKMTRTSCRLRQRIASRRLLPSACLRSRYARAAGW